MRLSSLRTNILHRLRRRDGWLSLTLLLLDLCYVIAVAYMCVMALKPSLAERLNFGTPGSPWAIALVLAFPIAHFALRRLAGKPMTSGSPLIVIAAMAVSALVLGMSAYWRCYDDQAPLFAPLAWTLNLFLGNVEPITASDTCVTMPIALELARLLALATTLTAAMSAGLALFRSQLDRMGIWRARSLTIVVGLSDEMVSMLRAIVQSQDPKGAVVVLTDDVDSEAARRARVLGAKLRAVDFAESEDMSQLPLWIRLDRLYLLSYDPVENLKRFNVIDLAVSQLRRGETPIPLTVRIDDPWQAEVWRRSFLKNTERRWVADAVGRFEASAAKLTRHITTSPTSSAGGPQAPTTVVLCGLSPLTYAMASELAQLQRELRLISEPRIRAPSNVIIFAEGAKSFVDDHDVRQGRLAPDGLALPVVHHDEAPTVDAITTFLKDRDPGSHTFVLGDPALETQGTRLASRFPTLRLYLASDAATSLFDISIVGHLYSFPINLELDPDAPQDAWERAAELIHELYSSGRPRNTPTTLPWKDLDPFIRQSNRRQLLNALRIVESIGGHSWNSLERTGPTTSLPADFASLPAMEQLRLLDFDPDTVERMAEAEHEDWRKYYLDAGWTYHAERKDDLRRHDKLLPWNELVSKRPDFRADSQRSLASTLLNLRGMGYRSVPRRTRVDPVWSRFLRRGEVDAAKRDSAWTWTTSTGEVLHAQSGDWAVVDDDGVERSVAAAVFESTYEQIGPQRYRRLGTLLARRTAESEIVHTLEGDVVANEGDWVVEGAQGEHWPVPDHQFRKTYDGPLDDELGN